MSVNYTYSPDWVGRDSQPEASPLRIIKAVDFLNEWTSIKTAFAACAPTATPTFTGTATFDDISVGGTINGETLNVANWNTAFSWGDHAAAGYLTASSGDATTWNDTSATVTAKEALWDTAAATVTTKQSNWDTAVSWGDHAAAGYVVGPVSFSELDAATVITSAELWTGSADNQIPTIAAVEERLTTGGFISDYNVTQADVTQHQAALTLTKSQISDFGSYLSDAPSDGTQYARKDGAWTAVAGSSGGTVTSVAASASAGLTVSGGPITTSGTLAFSVASGYAIPTTAKQGTWDAAFSWGNHANAGYALNNGSNASGTWGISITGNAATATSATSATSASTATTATNCSRSVNAGTNLIGGGALSSNVTLSLNSTLTSLTDVQTNNLSIGSWDIKLDSNDLRFQYNGTDVFRITTAGQLIAKGDVTAFGAP